MSMTGASRARPGDRPCITYVCVRERERERERESARERLY